MRTSRIVIVTVLGLAVLVGAAATVSLFSSPSAAATEGPTYPSPSFGGDFWEHWGDGRAELAGYELTYPRYGEKRPGSAVTVFVTQPFSKAQRVKPEAPDHPESDKFQVMKLNLVQDFSTGVYDYNLMTSAFAALEPVHGHPAGTLTKVAFSSQEWCGQVHAQYKIDPDRVRHTLHSYFAGEADQRNELPYRSPGLVEDGLLLWARGFTGPRLEPGEKRTVPLLKGLERARLEHEAPGWTRVTLRRSEKTRTVSVPAGRYEVVAITADIENGPKWTVLVEPEAPHRIVRWRTDQGREAELTGVKRMPYWKMNGRKYREAVEELGLKVRPPGSM